MAGRLGEGLLWLDRSLLEPYRGGLEEGGHDPVSARMGGLANVILADDPEAVAECIRPHHRYQRESYRRYAAEGRTEGSCSQLPRSITEEARELPAERRDPRANGRPPRLHVLAPDEAARFVHEWLEGLPVAHVFFWESIAGMPDDLADRHVELVATTLVPALASSG